MTRDLVSCLMVTRNRRGLAARALECFAAQTWDARELVIVDDGDDDYTSLVIPYVERGLHIRYHRIEHRDGVYLGELRNYSIDVAHGEWCMQWDDDEWYHPDRISVQMSARKNRSAVALRWTLVDMPSSPYGPITFRANTGLATPGTILFRRGVAARYDNIPRNEDGRFLRAARQSGLTVLGREHSHLFVRCYHGSNTWEQNHFLRRLRRTPRDLVPWALARATGDIKRHPALALTALESSTAAALHAYECPEVWAS